MEPEDIAKLIKELHDLNQNLRDSKAATQVLVGNLKDIVQHTKAIYGMTKQLGILNQILLQVSKKAGTSAMLSNLLEAIITLGRRSM